MYKIPDWYQAAFVWTVTRVKPEHIDEMYVFDIDEDRGELVMMDFPYVLFENVRKTVKMKTGDKDEVERKLFTSGTL